MTSTGPKLREILDRQGQHHDAPVRYLDRPPVGCSRCERSVIYVTSAGQGDMYTCTGGCGQRYWVDR